MTHPSMPAPVEPADPITAACAEDLRVVAPGAGDDDLTREAADLCARWQEPQRQYHTLRHLLELLGAITRLAPAAGLGPRDVAVARVAAWFHDAVYDPAAAPGANEEASGVLAIDALDRLGSPASAIEDVARLVAATADHSTAPNDPLTDVFLDADLAILGADVDRFDEYCAQVRAEYAAVPDDVYRAARLGILQRLADGELYRTSAAREAWDAAARANLAREVERLR